MMMKRIFSSLFATLAFATAAHAQEQVTVGNVLDLEERVLIKKMSEELSKPNPNTPPALPVAVIPKTPKIVYPTQTLAVYGTSHTSYEGQLSMGGKVYTVQAGSPVGDYTVTSVAPHGIELAKNTKTQRRGKSSSGGHRQTLFAPLAH